MSSSRTVKGCGMITSLHLVDFKNFANETLRLGPFTVLVGANASGKSNIRDAFRFLHGIGRGYTLAEIIGGRYGAGGHAEWGEIRGAPNEVSRLGQSFAYYGFKLGVSINEDTHEIDYSIGVQSDIKDFRGFRVVEEELADSCLAETIIYTSHPKGNDPISRRDEDPHLPLRMGKSKSQRRLGNKLEVRPDQPALTQIREHRNVLRTHKNIADSTIDALGRMRFLDVVPDRMRQPAFPGQLVLGDGGENLPTVLRDICSNKARRKNLIDWIRELTPMDVADFEFPIDPVTGLVQLVVYEKGGNKLSARSMSDGTLRFLAVLSALLAENTSGLYFLEEIDNGIHPSRLSLLVDLIESQTSEGKVQVVATTHSPGLLSIIGDTTFKNTSVVCRLEGRGDAIVRPISKIPKANKLRKSQGLGRLMTGGWMENILNLSEDINDDSGKS